MGGDFLGFVEPYLLQKTYFKYVYFDSAKKAKNCTDVCKHKKGQIFRAGHKKCTTCTTSFDAIGQQVLLMNLGMHRVLKKLCHNCFFKCSAEIHFQSGLYYHSVPSSYFTFCLYNFSHLRMQQWKKNNFRQLTGNIFCNNLQDSNRLQENNSSK